VKFGAPKSWSDDAAAGGVEHFNRDLKSLKRMRQSLLLRDCVQAHAQAGLVSRRRVLVKHALLDRFVEGGYGLAKNLIGSLVVTFGERLAQIAKRGAQAGSVGAVAKRAFLSLTGAFQRRKMICHVIRLPSFSGFPSSSKEIL
jgi:hypothetical protein